MIKNKGNINYLSNVLFRCLDVCTILSEDLTVFFVWNLDSAQQKKHYALMYIVQKPTCTGKSNDSDLSSTSVSQRSAVSAFPLRSPFSLALLSIKELRTMSELGHPTMDHETALLQ